MFPEEELKDGERESYSDFNILAKRPEGLPDDDADMFLKPSRVNVASFHSKNPTADADLRAFSVAHGRMSVRNDQLSRDDFHEDYMEKQSPNLFKVWQKRYFVLVNRMLKYFKTKQDYSEGKAPKGVINFN